MKLFEKRDTFSDKISIKTVQITFRFSAQKITNTKMNFIEKRDTITGKFSSLVSAKFYNFRFFKVSFFGAICC